jgi:hypothetical protein
MVTRLRRINPIQLGLVLGILYGIFTFIVALIVFPFSGMMAGSGMPMNRMFGLGFGAAMVVVLPIAYFFISFIVGVIGALLYNLVAGWTGGIEIELQPTAAAPLGGYST